MNRVRITAHRGASSLAPENTLSAIAGAIDEGADFAEIDVQETADGVLVVLHDADLVRTAGVDRKIWEIDYEELRHLDAGRWFSREFQGERVPTLAEVIEAAGNAIRLNIELKFNGHERNLVERTVETLRKTGFGSRAVVTSLGYQGVVEAKRMEPSLGVGYILSGTVEDLSRLAVDFLSVDRALVTSDLIAHAHARGKDVHVWTVNERREMSLMIDMGVDNIITDEPGRLRQLLEERAG